MSNWNQLTWSRTCFELIIGATLSLLLYLTIMNIVVSKSLLFSSDAKRVIEIYKFCSLLGSSAHKPANLVIGSSIAVEGIDADIVDTVLDNGTASYNLGVVGLTPVEALMLEPALKTGKPQIVVIGVDAMSIGISADDKESINFEKLQAYRATNIVTRMDELVKKELLENILLPNEKAIIESDYLRYLIGCRSLPLFFTESKFREMARKGLRTEGITTNFKAPWMLKSNLIGETKERILNSAIEKAQRLSFNSKNRNIKALQVLISSLRASNIEVMVVLWPVHPHILSSLSVALTERIDLTLNQFAHEYQCRYKDYSKLLTDSDFADALHPNVEGRAKLSTNLAVDLKFLYPNYTAQ